MSPRQLRSATVSWIALFLASFGVRGQSELITEGMVTPLHATEASEVVVVQAQTEAVRPGPPVIASLDPPRLLLSSVTAGGGSAAAAGEPTVATNLGRLPAGTWQVSAFDVDWGAGRAVPRLGTPEPPATFRVSRGEVFTRELVPVAGRFFELVVRGPWTPACAPRLDRVVVQVQPPRVLVDTIRPAGCLGAASVSEPVETVFALGPLDAGLYAVEVRDTGAGGSPDPLAATSLRIAPLGEPRLRDLALEEDLQRDSHRLAIDVEIPTFSGPQGCASWIVTPTHGWVHGRDLYAELQVEPLAIESDAFTCGGASVQRLEVPLPELETGLYRIQARRRELDEAAPVSGELWAVSRTLVAARKLAQRIEERFRVTLDWRDATGRTGRATPVLDAVDAPGAGGQSALFSFFDQDNWEVLVKVLDGCALNGYRWVFAAASTDLEYLLTIEDAVTGESVSYRNELGQASPAITDTTALASCE